MRAPWIVTLVCGASGTGKSCVARPLAARYGVPLAEADDIVTAVQAITTPQQQPMLHFWETHPEFSSWAPQQIVARHLEVASALRPAYAAVIADHVEFAAPVVFEGDYLLPELAAGQVPRCARWCLMSRTRIRSRRTTAGANPADSSATVPGSVPWSARS